MILQFKDSVTFDSDSKRAVSVRDGVLYYLGSEIGQVPVDKQFSVYRSPATICKALQNMPGIKVTDNHVSTDAPVELSIGEVGESKLIDIYDEESDARMAVESMLTLDRPLDPEKRELSLGYKAQLVPHDKYDFEQKEIKPHHLATVSEGRCGSFCSFLDKESIKKDGVSMAEEEKKEITDEDVPVKDEDVKEDVPVKDEEAPVVKENTLNIEQIVETAMRLPEALKKLDVKALAKVMPVLKGIVDETKIGTEQDENKPEEDVEVQDTDEFKDAVSSHISVIDRAREFVDASYEFKGKSTKAIMADSVKTQYDQSFTDSELPTVFKMLKKKALQTEFKDTTSDALDAVKNKEF